MNPLPKGYPMSKPPTSRRTLLYRQAAADNAHLTRLYDLAVQPEVAKDLRAEMKKVLAENGGVMTTKALQDMKLTDSFMKESQRLSPAFLSAFLRATVKPVTLSDGTYIPKDTFVCTPQNYMRDEILYPDPEVGNCPTTFLCRICLRYTWAGYCTRQADQELEIRRLPVLQAAH